MAPGRAGRKQETQHVTLYVTQQVRQALAAKDEESSRCRRMEVRIIDKQKTGSRSSADGNKRLAGRLVDGLVESQRRIMALIAENPPISKREMAENIGISTTAIDKHISVLKSKGFLLWVGPDKGGHWDIPGKGHE